MITNTTNLSTLSSTPKKDNKNTTKQFKTKNDFQKHWQLYIMASIPIAVIIIFHYLPMSGILIAFKDFSLRKGVTGSPWVGFKYFKQFFSSPDFFKLLFNTIVLSFYNFLATFIAPIILAIMLNEIMNKYFKKFVQMITFFPYMISMVILTGMLMQFLNPNGGLVNNIIQFFGFKPVYFMNEPSYFRNIFVGSGVWQQTGYGAVIYIAALSGIDPQITEASVIDGASRWQRIRHIDLPEISPTITIMLLLGVGRVMSLGHEKAFLLQNNLNMDVSEIIATYVYKRGLVNYQFSYATAVGLFNSVTNLILIIASNKLSKKLSKSSLW